MHVIAWIVCNGKFCNVVIFYVILLPQHLQDLCLLLVKRNLSSLSEAESLSWSRPAHKVYRSPCSCVGSRVLASGCERRLPFPDRKQRFRNWWPSQTQNILESWLTFHYSTCGFYIKLENPLTIRIMLICPYTFDYRESCPQKITSHTMHLLASLLQKCI